MAVKVPDLALLDGVVAPEILAAMRSASAQLTQAGIPHALAGALAVGAWGYPRASKDVNFLVGDEAFKRVEIGFCRELFALFDIDDGLGGGTERFPHQHLPCVVRSVSVQHEDQVTVIRVANTGSFIPAEERDKIFALFYTTKRGGSGFGLPQARRALADHGGDIELTSSRDEGTSFTLRFPDQAVVSEIASEPLARPSVTRRVAQR